MSEYDFTRCGCKACTYGHSDDPPQSRPYSEIPTPWMVKCWSCGPAYLTSHEYNRQMSRYDSRWSCPKCNNQASWDDDNYDRASDAQEEAFEAQNDTSETKE